jgi:protocatechuate 3,4-dioxygenase beta subunit
VKRAIFGALLLLGFAVHAQQPATATVEGIVTYLGKPDPISNVRMTFTPEKGSPRTVTTDRDGRFSATGLTAGRYRLAAARSGFIKPRRAAGPSNLTVTPGQRMQDVRLQMIAAGIISGRITDENREPMRGIMVEARGYPGGGRK